MPMPSYAKTIRDYRSINPREHESTFKNVHFIIQSNEERDKLLLLLGLLGSLGGGARLGLGGHRLDDTDSDGLPHVTDGEPTEGREVGEGLHAHGLAGDQLNDTGITGLDELGVALGRLT